MSSIGVTGNWIRLSRQGELGPACGRGPAAARAHGVAPRITTSENRANPASCAAVRRPRTAPNEASLSARTTTSVGSSAVLGGRGVAGQRLDALAALPGLLAPTRGRSTGRRAPRPRRGGRRAGRRRRRPGGRARVRRWAAPAGVVGRRIAAVAPSILVPKWISIMKNVMSWRTTSSSGVRFSSNVPPARIRLRTAMPGPPTSGRRSRPGNLGPGATGRAGGRARRRRRPAGAGSGRRGRTARGASRPPSPPPARAGRSGSGTGRGSRSRGSTGRSLRAWRTGRSRSRRRAGWPAALAPAVAITRNDRIIP